MRHMCGATITIRPPPNATAGQLKDFIRKGNALQRAAEAGQLRNQQSARSGSEQAAYRRRVEERINRMYHNNPTAHANATARFQQSHADHRVELQLGGSDSSRNMKMLNGRINTSVGSQIQSQLRHLPQGTPIVNVVMQHV